jgi:hypothetical protein
LVGAVKAKHHEGGLSWLFILIKYGGANMENMNELEKLKKLLYYWMEHNNRDAQNYRDWAEKASSLGNEELSKILIGLSDETKKLNRLFEEAIKMID